VVHVPGNNPRILILPFCSLLSFLSFTSLIHKLYKHTVHTHRTISNCLHVVTTVSNCYLLDQLRIRKNRFLFYHYFSDFQHPASYSQLTPDSAQLQPPLNPTVIFKSIHCLSPLSLLFFLCPPESQRLIILLSLLHMLSNSCPLLTSSHLGKPPCIIKQSQLFTYLSSYSSA
jgi:hypothetical protein